MLTLTLTNYKQLIINKLTFKANYSANEQFWYEYDISLKQLAEFNQCAEIRDVRTKV